MGSVGYQGIQDSLAVGSVAIADIQEQGCPDFQAIAGSAGFLGILVFVAYPDIQDSAVDRGTQDLAVIQRSSRVILDFPAPAATQDFAVLAVIQDSAVLAGTQGFVVFPGIRVSVG